MGRHEGDIPSFFTLRQSTPNDAHET